MKKKKNKSYIGKVIEIERVGGTPIYYDKLEGIFYFYSERTIETQGKREYGNLRWVETGIRFTSFEISSIRSHVKREVAKRKLQETFGKR